MRGVSQAVLALAIVAVALGSTSAPAEDLSAGSLAVAAHAARLEADGVHGTVHDDLVAPKPPSAPPPGASADQQPALMLIFGVGLVGLAGAARRLLRNP